MKLNLGNFVIDLNSPTTLVVFLSLLFGAMILASYAGQPVKKFIRTHSGRLTTKRPTPKVKAKKSVKSSSLVPMSLKKKLINKKSVKSSKSPKLTKTSKLGKMTTTSKTVKKSKKKPFIHRKALYSTKYYNPELLEFENLISFFESIIGKQISYSQWNRDVYTNSNGFFQYIVKDSKVTIHCDGAQVDYGVVIFLDKNPILGKGTSFYRHKKTGHEQEILPIEKYDTWKEEDIPKYDKWEKLLSVNNFYNRALIFNSKRFHCSDGGYGTNKSNARFFQTFFFGLLK